MLLRVRFGFEIFDVCVHSCQDCGRSVFYENQTPHFLTIVYIGHIYIFTISSIHEVIRNSRSRGRGPQRRRRYRLGGSVRCTHAGRATKVSRIRRQRMVATTVLGTGPRSEKYYKPQAQREQRAAGNRLCGPGRGRRPQAQGRVNNQQVRLGPVVRPLEKTPQILGSAAAGDNNGCV
ncbi:hypothetical protein EVAR_95103_1 [Eumeta japonica]|uniref:Uncharacterized protein n=1 Tax=Eumeta variegata TaxID=151549 RepID=A0A4C1W6F0_EUMVA|nr:hypothetical protein EVAR_95103_1 [Eumeta japonica]